MRRIRIFGRSEILLQALLNCIEETSAGRPQSGAHFPTPAAPAIIALALSHRRSPHTLPKATLAPRQGHTLALAESHFAMRRVALWVQRVALWPGKVALVRLESQFGRLESHSGGFTPWTVFHVFHPVGNARAPIAQTPAQAWCVWPASCDTCLGAKGEQGPVLSNWVGSVASAPRLCYPLATHPL